VSATDIAAPLSPAERARLGRRAQLLACVSVTYNVLEAVVAVSAGVVAGSVALLGFGLDSVVEVSSGLIILWQFRHHMPETRERQALRLMAFAFFALAAYVTVEAVRTLIGAQAPDPSPVGTVLVALSVVIMPFLSWAQRRAGREIGSASAVADSKQTLLCTYLSAAVLVGLVLNSTLGWWWADPVVALGLAVVAVKEGRAALRGQTCCPPIRIEDQPELLAVIDDTDEHCGCAAGCAGACCEGHQR
jgi:divalent metal cation (Fe/Co/Zn/Cd) transporter